MPVVARPTLLFDGDCGICRTWVRYWQNLTRGAVIFRPYQAVAPELAGINRSDLARAICLIEPDGRSFWGAAAAFRALHYAPHRGGWWWAYRNVPAFGPVSERVYAFLARRRGLLRHTTVLLWGPVLEPPSYILVNGVFLRLLGAIYAAAFASLAVQIVGLVGHAGILPVAEYLSAAYRAWGTAAWWRLPTLFWLSPTDVALRVASTLGVALGLCILIGVMRRAAPIAAFALYLSLVHAGQVFTNFQWDQLLLEAGFLAIFLTAGSRIVVWLYRWLVFRFLFLAGVAKLVSGDPAWRRLTALTYHFWTQPLPSPLAWYAARLPDLVLAFATAATLAIEIGLVFLIFLPRRPRAVAASAALLFQTAILITGNYGFFNLLTMLLCLFLFDDAALRRLVPVRLQRQLLVQAPRPGPAATAMATALALIVVPAGLDRVWRVLIGGDLPLAGALVELLSPFEIVNPYGPFATTTTTRPEIIIEGSDDARHWREYPFRFKPGPVSRCPSWNIPHQPRLDWQLWFAAYGSAAENPWFAGFMRRLLEGSPSVLTLMAEDPFADHPRKYLRALIYDYRFSDPAAHRAGACWTRRAAGLYFPQATLEDFSRGEPRN